MSERNDMTRLSGAYPGRDGVQTRLDRAQRLVVEADVILRKIDSIRKGQQNVL